MRNTVFKVSKILYRKFFTVFTFPLTILCLLGCFSCDTPTTEIKKEGYQTKNIIIVVIDGARFNDVWTDNSLSRIPNMAKTLRPNGTFFSKFYNNGYTWTSSGHTAITTGFRQTIDNNGKELPKNPSMFQYWLKHSGKPSTSAWIITSKGKLNVLANTQNPEWQNSYQPSINCGVNSSNNGYRSDSITYLEAKKILQQHHPNLVLINFKEPDNAGHGGNWNAYLQGITASDKYVGQLWEFIQSDNLYKNKTSLFITNDHGRHNYGTNGDFISHGDDCEGCQHISLLALGPDFAKGKTVETPYNQTDISATIAELLGFKIDFTQGQPIKELLTR